jgi:hypothetical protein
VLLKGCNYKKQTIKQIKNKKMKITFNETKDITIVSEKKKAIDKITIEEMIDIPSRKLIVVITQEVGRIRLWQGAEYDAIGQWTDTDVENRIKEIYGA